MRWDAFNELHPNRDEPQRIVSGVISRDNNDETVGLWVYIPSYDNVDRPALGAQPKRTEWGPCPWDPKPKRTTDDTSGAQIATFWWPRKGDLCWVAFDQEDRPVVTCYWPSSFERLPQTEK